MNIVGNIIHHATIGCHNTTVQYRQSCPASQLLLGLLFHQPAQLALGILYIGDNVIILEQVIIIVCNISHQVIHRNEQHPALWVCQFYKLLDNNIAVPVGYTLVVSLNIPAVGVRLDATPQQVVPLRLHLVYTQYLNIVACLAQGASHGQV